jgi:hypothetical protein
MVTKHRPTTPRDDIYRPPKAIEQLARDQGLDGPPPDYVALASAVWRTKDELREFQRHLKAIRRPSKS